MIPVAFDHVRADSAEAAVAALAEHGDEAKLLAGGHSLLPLMKLRLATPAVLVDVGEVADLRYVAVDGEEVAIGALTRQRELERSEVLAAECPLVSTAAATIGDPQVRARGTIGGSLAHADPASDLPAVALALDASLVIQGPSGRRTVAAVDFFQGFWTTALADDEMLVEVRVPRTGATPFSFQKITTRAQDWATVGAAVIGGDTPRVALVNMGDTPLRASATEQALAGGAAASDAADQAADGTSPVADLKASVEYRAHLARVVVGRGLAEAGIG